MERNGNSKFKPLDDTTVKRLVNLAEETAAQILPTLWQKLYSDSNHKKTLPEELRELLGRRLRDEAFDFYVRIEVMRMNPAMQGAHKGFLRGIDHVMDPGRELPLVRRVYDVFVRQLKEYGKKYKEDICQTIMKAKEGNTMAIRHLLEWDKAWIEFDFIHGEISRRGCRYRLGEDDRFLEMVGNAIGKKPGIKKYTEESGLLVLIEIYANRYDLSGNNNKELKNLHYRLINDGVFDSGNKGRRRSPHRV